MSNFSIDSLIADMISSVKTFIPNRLKRNCKGFLRNAIESFKYYGSSGRGFFLRPPLVNKKVTSIIFVCKGNVCRSAFAESRLQYLLGPNEMNIDSCGVDVDQGSFPPPDSVTVAAEFSCSLAGRRAKGVAECDMKGADLILPVEYWQYKRLLQCYPEKEENIFLLRSLAPFPYCFFCNIADPYGWGETEFRRSYCLVDRALQQIVHWC